MSQPEDENLMRRTTLARAFRSLRPFALVAIAGLGVVLAVVLGARAFWMWEASRHPPSLPAPIDSTTPISYPGSSSSESHDPRASLQAIGEKSRAIKEDVGKISDNLGKLKEDSMTPGDTASKTGSGLNEATKKLRAQLDAIAAATEPGGKVDSALESLQRAVAPDGPLATKLKAAEEKTAELAKRRKARPETTPKPRGDR